MKSDTDNSNVKYTFSDDGLYGYGTLKDGTVFIFDADLFDLIKDIKWYAAYKNRHDKSMYIIDRYGRPLHKVLFSGRKGYELDHINLDTLDNRRCNVRFCTHQQNQMNQSLQRNNTSGVSGVRFYKPRNKYVARIKICQRDIHLGYYTSIKEATQARNIGMECLFGECGVYNDVEEAPKWIRDKVTEKCSRFASYSANESFRKKYRVTGQEVVYHDSKKQ